MKTTKLINEYKVLIYALIVISIFGMKFGGLLPSSLDKDLVIATAVVLIFSLGFFIEFVLRRIIMKLYETKSAFKELERDLSKSRRTAVVVIRNAPFSDLALRGGFAAAIKDENLWDWWYIGNHPDCDQLCSQLLEELEKIYVDSPEADSIKTSSLTYLKQYPFEEESLVFICNLTVPKKRRKSKDFPEDIWEAVLSEEYKVSFDKLYIIESSWDADKTECTIRRIAVEHDPWVIKKKWNKVYELVRTEVAKTKPLVYKDHSPTDEEKTRFFEKLRNSVCKICHSTLFVVSTSAGRALSVARKTLSENKLAGSLIFLGWLLSPLSFYNDFAVNLPLTVAISYPFIRFWNWNKPLVTGVAYTFTNVMGFVFIFLGLSIAKKEPKWRVPIVRTLVIFVFYLTAISMTGKFLFEYDWSSVLKFISQLF